MSANDPKRTSTPRPQALRRAICGVLTPRISAISFQFIVTRGVAGGNAWQAATLGEGNLEEIYDHANPSSVCCPRFYGCVLRAVPRRPNRLGKGRRRARQDRVSTRQCPPLRHTAQ